MATPAGTSPTWSKIEVIHGTGYGAISMSNEQSTRAFHGDMRHGGHLYMQTNETRNAVIHYLWSANGTIAEMERAPTDGFGSGAFSPIYQINRPNDFEGAGSVILTPDRRFLLTTNAGDNSVSSFGVGEDGQLTLLDVKPTGNAVTGRSGTADSLAYAPSSGTLFVLHAFGPDHIRLLSVDGEGKLEARPERYSVNTHPPSTTGEAPCLSTWPSCTAGRIASSSERPSVTGSS
jgi:hypothetical protein